MQTAYGTADQADEAATTYTANGKTATATDAEGNTTTYEYDGIDRLLKTRYPDTTAGAGTSSTTDYEQLGYDAASNVTSRRVRDGQSIAYAYDALGRLTLKDRPNAAWLETDVTYGYDNLGRLTQAADSWPHTLTFAYDALGRETSETSAWLGTTAWQHDLAGRRTRMTWGRRLLRHLRPSGHRRGQRDPRERRRVGDRGCWRATPMTTSAAASA